MKKTLLTSVAAFALVLGASGAAWAAHVEQESVAVSVQVLEQETTNIAIASSEAENHSTSDSAAQEVDVHHGMDFGRNTFRNQVLDVNNFQQGINQAQQGAISVNVSANIN